MFEGEWRVTTRGKHGLGDSEGDQWWIVEWKEWKGPARKDGRNGFMEWNGFDEEWGGTYLYSAIAPRAGTYPVGREPLGFKFLGNV